MSKARKPPAWQRAGYKSAYAYRNAKAQAAGYRSYNAERTARSLEATGLTPAQRRAIRKRVPVGPLPEPVARARQTPVESKRKLRADTEWMMAEDRAYAEAYEPRKMNRMRRSRIDYEKNVNMRGDFLARNTSGGKRRRTPNEEKRVGYYRIGEALRRFDEDLARTNPEYVRDYYHAFVDGVDAEHPYGPMRSPDGSPEFYEHDGQWYSRTNQAWRNMVLKWAPRIPWASGFMSAADFAARYGEQVFAV